MIVIWGTRNAGKVDGRDGQYALTRFAHVYWLPLFPVSAMWVTRDGFGHEMKLSGKSVVAGYARTWGPLLGALGIAGVGGTTGFVAALAGVVTAALSLAWKDVQSPAAKRRSDLNQLAYGTRCEPKLLTAGLPDSIELEMKQRWAVISDGQTPNDIARFGTDDLSRAATAYGILRLSARHLPAAQAADAEHDAGRIAEGVREKLALGEGGPYRSAAVDASLSPEAPPKR